MSDRTAAVLPGIGRLGLASLFILGGINKALNYQSTLERMSDVGLTPASLLLPATIALELIGGACVAYGRRPAAFAALALFVFTLATNYWFHRFWELDGEIAALELSLFFKNVAIAGGLLLLVRELSSQGSHPEQPSGGHHRDFPSA
ncbi:MAG: DoxX family protein [Pseudomonadota bacterium]